MELDIFNPRPREVMCVSNDTYGMKINSDNNKVLEVGWVYHLVKLVVHSWYTEIYLFEFPDLVFNSVDFNEVTA